MNHRCCHLPRLPRPNLAGWRFFRNSLGQITEDQKVSAKRDEICVDGILLPVEGSEIPKKPVEVGALSHCWKGFSTSQVIRWMSSQSTISFGKKIIILPTSLLAWENKFANYFDNVFQKSSLLNVSSIISFRGKRSWMENICPGGLEIGQRSQLVCATLEVWKFTQTPPGSFIGWFLSATQNFGMSCLIFSEKPSKKIPGFANSKSIFFMTRISLQIHNGDNVPTIVSSKPTFHPIPYEILAPKIPAKKLVDFLLANGWLKRIKSGMVQWLCVRYFPMEEQFMNCHHLGIMMVVKPLMRLAGVAFRGVLLNSSDFDIVNDD